MPRILSHLDLHTSSQYRLDGLGGWGDGNIPSTCTPPANTGWVGWVGWVGGGVG